MSERRACRVVGAHRRTMRYRHKVRGDEPQVRERLRALATEHPRWGYRRLHFLLQREGMAINRKRVYRLYRLDGLAVRRQKRKSVFGEGFGTHGGHLHIAISSETCRGNSWRSGRRVRSFAPFRAPFAFTKHALSGRRASRAGSSVSRGNAGRRGRWTSCRTR